jgi:type II protein arginine methyltransferase
MHAHTHTHARTEDVSQLLHLAREDAYDFVTTSLSVGFDDDSTSPAAAAAAVTAAAARRPPPPPPRVDVTTLSGRWWRTSVVGVIQEDSVASPEMIVDSLGRQIEWAIHMGIPAVLLPSPPRGAIVEYSRVVNSMALQAQASNVQVWIRTELNDASLDSYELLLRLCNGMPNIGMIVVMDPNLALSTALGPSTAKQLVLVHRAVGVGIKAVAFPTKIFLTNKRGFPTLSKAHQHVFGEILKRIGRTVRCLVEGPSNHDKIEKPGKTRCLAYVQYIRYLREKDDVVAVLDSEEAQMETPYLDSLQRPLEPLKDNLEFSMYETFEKDPVKYSKYQEAVYLALKSGVASMELSSAKPKLIVIAVAGAGRGPLVMRSIHAFKQLTVPPNSLVLKVFAIEKNPSALVFLESMAHYNPEWKGTVTVIKSDARQLSKADLGGTRIDIVVSELLGSFGDNELSPECLDPLLASGCCKSSTVSIPMRYSSYLAPVCSSRLHADAVQQSVVPDESGQPLGIQRAMETAYVVRSHAASQTHPEQRCWEFTHPASTTSKERTATLEFAPDHTLAAGYGCGYGPVDKTVLEHVAQVNSSVGYTVHGLLGTFTAVLFEKDGERCEISIAPHAFSTEMFSWFPIYFPFHNPLRVPANSNVSVKMWRKTSSPSKSRVWFEWCAMTHRQGEIIEATPIHNPNGRSSFVSL